MSSSILLKFSIDQSSATIGTDDFDDYVELALKLSCESLEIVESLVLCMQ